jgi:hypothetical protein
MLINDNTVNLQQYKGAIKPCPLCAQLTPDAALDALTRGRACRLCFDKKWVAVCLNCDGTGQYKGKTVWDGGRSDHTSTCTPCGGNGVFPANKPATVAIPKSVENAPVTV